MRAAVYLRQSVDRDGEGLAVARQREDCLTICRERGWEPAEYLDNDRSATRGSRPDYLRMLADIESGVIGAVVTWDLDRLHRRPAELESFIDLADRKGLKLATVGGDADLSTDNGRLFARIKGAVAKAEVERKSARQKRANQQRAEAGKAWGSRRPFGYTPKPGLPDSKKIGAADCTAIEPVESALLRQAYADVLQGASLYSICKRWNRDGVTTSQGSVWRSAQLRQVLLNPRNMGVRTYGGAEVGRGDWAAVVDEPTWRAVKAVLDDPGRRHGSTRARKYLLTGIALCGECAAPIGSAIATGSGKPVYRCKACHRVSRAQTPVDDLVVGVIGARLSRNDVQGLLQDELAEDFPELQAHAAVLRAKLNEMAEAYAVGGVTMPQLLTATKAIQAELSRVEGAMAHTERTRMFDGLIGAEDVESAFLNMELDRQRAVVEALLAITINKTAKGYVFRPEDVVIELKDGRAGAVE